MSEQTCLVRIYDRHLYERGDIIHRHGLDWKFMPSDPIERAEWDKSHRDDVRVEARLIDEWRGRPGAPGTDGTDDGLPGYPTTWRSAGWGATLQRLA